MEKTNLTFLIHAHRSGSEDALILIIEKMKPLVTRYAKKAFFNEPEDSAQEFNATIIHCAKTIPEYTSEARCLAYFEASVKNRYYQMLNEYYSRNSLISSYTELPENICDHRFEYDTLKIHILQTIESTPALPDNKKKIFYLLFQEYSCAEIARRMHVSRQYVHRVRKQLASLLSSD